MSHYLALTFDVPAELEELASSLLDDAQAAGIELRDHELVPPPGLQPIPAGRVVVIGYLEDREDGATRFEEIRRALEAEARGREVRASFERLDDQPWAETWKLHFKPLHVGGKLWVLPPWEEPPADSIAVTIEPGLAFGTGGHATTALCLEGILETLDDLEERSEVKVLDVGCGSGILGIAAAKLGAGRVVMIDNDPVAVQVARENAAANGCPTIESKGTPIEAIEERFDLVIANILALPLIELAPAIARAVGGGGTLLLSGILGTQAAEVRAAYEAEGLVPREDRRRQEWSMLVMSRPGVEEG